MTGTRQTTAQAPEHLGAERSRGGTEASEHVEALTCGEHGKTRAGEASIQQKSVYRKRDAHRSPRTKMGTRRIQLHAWMVVQVKDTAHVKRLARGVKRDRDEAAFSNSENTKSFAKRRLSSRALEITPYTRST